MSDHFLADFVSGKQSFEAKPWYNPHGDCVVFQMADEAIVANRVDEILTIYESAIDRRPIGFQIKGVQAIIRKFGYEGLTIDYGRDDECVTDVCVAALLLAAYEEGPRTVRRRSAYAGAINAAPKGSSIKKHDMEAVPC